ncbi:MAG: dockerin type I domain-containing protein, partial [Ruminococcus sp.]
MRKSFKKALSLVLALAMIMSMACITNITASAETNQYMLGDVNMDGLVNVNDATTIQRFAASLITLSDNQRYLADVNGDGLVNVNDATYVQRYAANLLSSYEENPDGIKIGEIVDFGEDPTLPTPPATTETATETVAPTTQPETNPSVDYSKYSLVGYINGADAGSGDDYENAPYVFSADGTQTLTVTETSYVFVKTTNNSSWYMFEELCQGTSGILKNTADGTSEKMMVPAGEVTFTLVEYVDGTLGLSYVVGGETEPATTAPATEEPTEAPTQAPTEAPTTPVGSINVSVDNQTTWLYKDGAALFFYDNATGEHYAVDANGVATIPEEATNLTLYRCKESWGNGSKTDEVTSYWNKFGPLTRAADETILTIKGSSDYYWTKGETPTQAVTTAPVTEPDTTAPATEPDTTAPVELSNYRLLGTLTSWNPDEVEAMPYIEDGVAGMTLELAAGTYNFKLKGTSNWYGNNGTIIDTTVTTSTGGWVMSTSEDDCTLEATGGTYTFKFDVNTKKLIVLWDGYQADTTAPVTEPETTVPETTEEVTEAPTETQGEAITLYYLPKAEDVAAGYFFRANVKVTTDGTSDWRQYPLTALEGTPYYTATITPDYDSIDTIQYQVYSDAEFETWVSQIRFDGVTSIKTYADKVADAATGTLKELGEEETTAPATEPETTAPVEETTAPAVDYSKYSLVGYI